MSRLYEENIIKLIMSDLDNILLEDVNHKFDAILEGQAALASLPADVAQLKADMIEVKADVRTIKAVVISHSSQLENHEQRITRLEQSA